MLTVFILFLGIFFPFTFCSTFVSDFSADNLKDLLVKLDLTRDLLNNIKTDPCATFFIPQLNLLADALSELDLALFQPKILSAWCVDPSNFERHNEILLAAYRKDMDDPFADSFNLTLLDSSVPRVKSIAELRTLANYTQIIEDIRMGRIHFIKKKNQFYKDYRQSVKSHLRKAIASKIESLPLNKFWVQTGKSLPSIKELSKRWSLDPKGIGMLGSYLQMQTARRIFVNLPFIKFIPIY